MGSRNFSPDDRPPVRFMETDELAYVAMRAREVHDFWHTLFGLPTNLIGESALKVIEFEQMCLPMCLLSVLGGTARFNEKQRKLFFQHYFQWAIRAGMQCTDLMCIYYEQHFHQDLEDVRRKWGIIPAPLPPKENIFWAAAKLYLVCQIEKSDKMYCWEVIIFCKCLVGKEIDSGYHRNNVNFPVVESWNWCQEKAHVAWGLCFMAQINSMIWREIKEKKIIQIYSNGNKSKAVKEINGRIHGCHSRSPKSRFRCSFNWIFFPSLC